MSAFSRILLSLASGLLLNACVPNDPGTTDGGEQPPPGTTAPTVTLTARLATIDDGSTTQLTWSSTGANTCEAAGGWSGTKPLQGSAQSQTLNSTTVFTLTCTGAGGTISQSVEVTVTPPPTPPLPAITLSASPATVAYNASSTLRWSATNATSCTASGAWAGSRTTSGSSVLDSLTSSGTYTLTCVGAGGSATQSTAITVLPAPVPAVTFSANPLTVSYNGAATLTWSTENAVLCTGSGAWSGNKTTSGSLNLSGLTGSQTYTLSCSGPGGSASKTVTITVVSAVEGSIKGSVDSSRINRNGVNKVYLYAGTATPDDYDGDSGDPIASAVVRQEENSCGFSYSLTNVVPGNYTIAFTNQAANDVPGVNDSLSFIGTANITVGSSLLTKNFAAARVLTVGSGKSYPTPKAAAAVAVGGDVIEIDAGIYQNDVVVWRQNNLTLRGVGGRAHMQGTQVIPYTPGVDTENGMGIWVANGSGIVVENIEFSGARVTDENGAGIRANGNGLIVCNGYFHDNENGILGGSGEVLIEYSEFNHNGIGDPGKTHNLYMDYAVSKFIFRHNYSHQAVKGHELKSRAVTNYILYNRLTNEDGTASYNVDIPSGGLTYIIGNFIQQGPNTDNWSMVNYATEERIPGRTDNLYLVSNTLVNDRSSGIFVTAHGSSKVIQLINNLLVGNGTDVDGPVAITTKITNLNTLIPNFINRNGYDYRLAATSPAINMGSDPGTLNGFDARPVYQYVHPFKREKRPSNGAYDIGAYEYVP